MTKHPQHSHHRTTRLRPMKAALAALGLSLLSGCASVYLVDNQVQSFARWSDAAASAPAAVPQAPQTYRFERLPSQTTGQGAAGQDALENLARVALAKVGWSAQDAPTEALWAVQVGGGTLRLPRAP